MADYQVPYPANFDMTGNDTSAVNSGQFQYPTEAPPGTSGGPVNSGQFQYPAGTLPGTSGGPPAVGSTFSRGDYQQFYRGGQNPGSQGPSIYAPSQYHHYPDNGQGNNVPSQHQHNVQGGNVPDQYPDGGHHQVNTYSNGQEHPYPYPIMRQPWPVITKSQNYPLQQPALAQITNRIAALEAEVEATKRAASDANTTLLQFQETQAQKDALNRKDTLKKNKKTTATQALVQNKVRWLLGVGGVDAMGKVNNLLPRPLNDGEEPQLLADKVTKKSHPNWFAGVSDPVKLSFCMRVTDLVMDHIGRDNQSVDPRYFDNCRKTYRAQNTIEGRERRSRKRALGKRLARKIEKARERRAALPIFRRIHGQDNTVGDYDAIQTDDMSSEHSDCGKVPQAVFNNHRKKSGGCENGWEVRPKRWHSSWLKLYFEHLATIRRQMPKEARDKNNDEDGEGTSIPVHRMPRFKGLPENDNHAAPALIRKKPLYEAMVSEAWMMMEQATYKQLPLTTAGLDEAELEYLADDELA
ncbi:hypothetical protein B0H13DRAFT_2380464 [Mycena leptocephala]|nr:hypothetical protein B0H13DRAFT_2380464 [Mycena leptocephala]